MLFLSTFIVALTVCALWRPTCAQMIEPDPGCTKDICYYRFELSEATWKEAAQNCESYHGNLASIRDQSTNTKLKRNTWKATYWFGLSKDQAGNFVWNDEPHVFNVNGFTDWLAGEPNEEGKCVAMTWSPTENDEYKAAWTTKDWKMKLSYICATPAQP